jgi:hypothetical protein
MRCKREIVGENFEKKKKIGKTIKNVGRKFWER